MNTLLTFDATRFNRHLSPNDDRKMVDYIVQEYGSALQYAIRYYEGNLPSLTRAYYDEAYLSAVLNQTDHVEDLDCHDPRKFISRVMNDDGTVISTKARYDELVELIIDAFNEEIGVVLRRIQFQARKINTVQVLGYENRVLRVLLSTDAPIIP
jgi:hypothetical protein